MAEVGPAAPGQARGTGVNYGKAHDNQEVTEMDEATRKPTLTPLGEASNTAPRGTDERWPSKQRVGGSNPSGRAR